MAFVAPLEPGAPARFRRTPRHVRLSSHRAVDEGGCNLRLQPDRTVALVRPDGTVMFHGSTIDRTAPVTSIRVAPEPEVGRTAPADVEQDLSRAPPAA